MTSRDESYHHVNRGTGFRQEQENDRRSDRFLLSLVRYDDWTKRRKGVEMSTFRIVVQEDEIIVHSCCQTIVPKIRI